MTNNPVVWFEIYVQDMQRAKSFYETVLGISLRNLESPTPGAEMWAFPWDEKVTGASGALVKMEDGPASGRGTLVYFACADCGLAAKKAADNGGRIF